MGVWKIQREARRSIPLVPGMVLERWVIDSKHPERITLLSRPYEDGRGMLMVRCYQPDAVTHSLFGSSVREWSVSDLLGYEVAALRVVEAPPGVRVSPICYARPSWPPREKKAISERRKRERAKFYSESEYVYETEPVSYWRLILAGSRSNAKLITGVTF